MTNHPVHAALPNSPGRALNISLWVLQVLLAILFLIAGAVKLFGASVEVELFDDIGLGQWFRYFIGVVELAGAIGLVIPRLAGLAALGLAGVMVGATITNLFVIDEPAGAITTVVLFGVSCFIAWARRAQLQTLASRLKR